MSDQFASPGSSEAGSRDHLRALINGYTSTQVLHAAARLRLADLLAAGPMDAAELAARSGADPDILLRLLNGLVAIGVISADGDRRYRLTAIGEGLREDAPGSLASFALLSGDEYYRSWLGFDSQPQDGVTAFACVFGAPLFEWYSQHPEAGERFNRRMAARVGAYAPAAAAASDLSQARRIVDIGGGHGVLLEAFLARWPHAQGVLFDLPGAATGGQQRLAAAGLADRVEVVAGDFFAGVAAGGDVYLLSQILRDWDDGQCAVILTNIRRAMAPDGRLLIVEMLMPEPGNRAPPGRRSRPADDGVHGRPGAHGRSVPPGAGRVRVRAGAGLSGYCAWRNGRARSAASLIIECGVSHPDSCSVPRGKASTRWPPCRTPAARPRRPRASPAHQDGLARGAMRQHSRRCMAQP